jgi:membrane peptidoglycan carboxypeptidase
MQGVPAHRNSTELTSLEQINRNEPRTVRAESIVIPRECDSRSNRAWRRKHGHLFALLLLLVAVCAGCVFEARTSTLQSWLFARWSSKLRYTPGPGPSDSIALPSTGPFDERRGYTRIADFSLRLQANGFRITEQARQTPALANLIRSGISPPFREALLAGLSIRDRQRILLHDPTGRNAHLFASFKEIPPILVQTLLFIENRSIGNAAGARENPAVDWLRSSKAVMLYGGRRLGLDLPLQGGSTLATQLQKFRHSADGRTPSPVEKLHQMIGASLAAYQNGPYTRTAREQLIVDYLNTVPLGAVPGVGEINGVLDGLRAWFAMNPENVVAALNEPQTTPEKAEAYKHVLALVCAVRAPTHYLVNSRRALESRVDAYTGLLRSAGIVDDELAAMMRYAALEFTPQAPADDPPQFVERKAVNAIRTKLGNLLGLPNLYDLDRLNLQIDSTIDSRLQEAVTTVLHQLASPAFVAANGLLEPHVLEHGDPSGVTYSFLLLESRPEGNVVRVHTDTLAAPFDINDGMKLELGSTAKLRTLAHYLEISAQLHDELSPLNGVELGRRAAQLRDPLSRWAALTLAAEPHLDLETFLNRALERRYSASPVETFFTAGGIHHFRNFEREDDNRIMTVREALVHSTNLVFIRLMRDLVLFHESRLPYNPYDVLANIRSPTRKALLVQIASDESRKHNVSFAWLLNTRNREAQDLRLRIRIERDAFELMAPYWRQLGFPFERLVPSYATAIGSSADRPAALAELMGIIANDGRRRSTIDIRRLSFAPNTPYETVLEPSVKADAQVMRTTVARLLRKVLAEVVEQGTARRLNSAFRDVDGSAIPIGGKTGSGDNRFETFSRDGTLRSARAVSRTAGFAFYLADRWFGAITASVSGPQSEGYTFTSSLPLAVLKLLAPTLSAAVRDEPAPPP